MVALTRVVGEGEIVSESPAEQLLSQQLGTQIARLRHARELSQDALAERAGISTNHLQLLESGLSDRSKKTPANPRLSTLIALSAALDVPLPELLG
ncbi:helix-turn-helix transcriptional regulator [Gordonia alkaliphila]|uniref:HTH cro/C1-type domain-containing protein n=1 Tax=Gordonia alkaliphila TaxID=1053547 RepID=A0ABP8YVG9_9ACTN